MIDVVIVGAGGTAREILSWFVERDSTLAYRCVGLLDDNDDLRGAQIGPAAVIGRIVEAGQWPNARFIDALGGPRSYRQRPRIIERAGVAQDRFETIVHPRAYVSPTSSVGTGCLIFPNATIGADTTLGLHVTVLPGAVINHDVRIGDYSIVTSGVNISGNVTIGRAAYLGAGSSIIGGVSVGDGALIGMGAVVLEDVAADGTVVGHPARPIRSRASAQ